MKASIVTASILAVILISCKPEKLPVSPDLPPTPLLTSDSQWGVASQSYQKVLSNPRSDGMVNGLLRQGDIVEIISKVSDESTRFYWLEIQASNSDIRGWVPENSLNVYDSIAQARTARAGMNMGH